MSGGRSTTIGLWLLVFGGIAVLVALWMPKASNRELETKKPSEKIEELLAEAARCEQKGWHDGTLNVVTRILKIEDNHPKATLFAARALLAKQQPREAMAILERLPRDDSPEGLEGGLKRAELELSFRSVSAAERELRAVLDRDPENTQGNLMLCRLLDLTGRRYEAIPFGVELLRQGNIDFETMMTLLDQTLMDNRVTVLLQINARDKREVMPRLGLSRTALWEGQPEASRILTEAIIKQDPTVKEAHVRLGALLLDVGDKEFVEWHKNLPEGLEYHPDLWMVRGQWARRNNQPKAAARCFWEALRRNPNEGPGARSLAQLLQQLDRSDDAEPLLERASLLSELRGFSSTLYKGRDQTPKKTVDALLVTLKKLGRDREAEAWNALFNGGSLEPSKSPRARNTNDVLAYWVDPGQHPVAKLDLSDWPLPDIESTGSESTSKASSRYVAKFENMAGQTGLDFTYVNAPDDSTKGKRIIELTGGGVGALDFDRDNWPDVYFTQGGMYPVRDGHAYRDKLFRNLAGRFEDVTDLAGIDCPGFGQGLGVGDLNADGFPDLYVANNGANQLFMNNGDGTFSDATSTLGDKHADWTTSVGIADADGDGLPEIYVVNYLTGEVDELICQTDGIPTICGPEIFESAQDRFFSNNGDGSFSDTTEKAEIVKANGKGLGVLIADFEENGTLQYFVANDGVPNFLFSKTLDQSPFFEMARATGVATSGDGVAQACMGITAADANGDDRLDFFVTNFDGEFNTLYTNLDGLFDDGTRSAKLHDASYRFVGFGTQFVDAELDGYPDLLVTNGHVADFVEAAKEKKKREGKSVEEPAEKKRRVATVTYRMPSQYFRNNSDGTFVEKFSEEVGPFFDEEHLGRSMARLDWNKDGREDVSISYLDSPSALLTNTSKKTGHFIALHLVGTKVNRDAVGTVVRLRDGKFHAMQQMTSGDGYQSANEKRLVFGLGDRTSVAELEVKWLDGSKQVFKDLRADTEYVVVQGAENAQTLVK